MKILTQSKTMIVNAEQADCINAINNGVYINFSQDTHLLGTYKDNERAMSVLIEIMRRLEVGVRTYVMPEE